MRAVYQKEDNIARIILQEVDRDKIVSQFPCMGTGGNVLLELDTSGKLIAILFLVATTSIVPSILQSDFKVVKNIYGK